LIIFDELKHAESIIKNGYRNKKYVNFDNIILVKYWRYKGLNESEIRKSLKTFMVDYQYLFNRNILDYKINRAIKYGMRYDLVTGVKVSITDKEIDLINTLDNIRLRKMMFIMLVVWKFKGMPNNFWIDNKDLQKLSEERMHNDTFWDCIHKIVKADMIAMVMGAKNRSFYKINLKTGGDPIIEISDFENPIYYYLNLFEPEKFIECEKCGVLIKLTIHNRKYCKDCARKVNIKQTINRNI